MTPLQQAVLEEYLNELPPVEKPIKMRGRNAKYGHLLERQYSYMNWAAQNIYQECLDNDHLSPVYIIEDYAEKMEELASRKSAKHSYMFSVANDTAQDMLDCLYALQGKEG